MLITEEQLREWLGIRQRGRLLRTLSDLKIPYVLGGGGRVCTTLSAIDAVLTGTKPTTERIEFA